jgi:chromosome segregation ATPase
MTPSTPNPGELDKLIAELRGMLPWSTPNGWTARSYERDNDEDGWVIEAEDPEDPEHPFLVAEGLSLADASLISRSKNVFPTLLDALATERARAEELDRAWLEAEGKHSTAQHSFEQAQAQAEELVKERDAAQRELSCCDDISLGSGLATGISELQTDRERLRAEVAELKARVESVLEHYRANGFICVSDLRAAIKAAEEARTQAEGKGS